MADMDAGPDGGTGWLDHYLLTGVAKDHWPRDMAEENLALLQLLFRYRENGCLEHKHWPGPLLDDEVVRSYLLVHRYRDCDWFNRERFERLVAALMITAVLESPESAADRMETCQRRWSLLLAKAAQAGYRLDKFRTLI
jgi:hypothetical protein